MFHGFLNSLHYPDDDRCQAVALCEARSHTDQLDRVARVLGYLAHHHAYQVQEFDREVSCFCYFADKPNNNQQM